MEQRRRIDIAAKGSNPWIQFGTEHIILSGASSGNLNRALTVAQKSGGVSNISADKPTLEDVFLLALQYSDGNNGRIGTF